MSNFLSPSARVPAPPFARTFFALLLLAPLARAQEPQPPLPLPGGAEDPKQKMMRLFGEVQKHMDEIDRLLLEASTKRSADEISAAIRKMDELLRAAEKNQASTIEKIDEIIKNAPQQQGGGKGKQKKPQPPQQNDGQPQPQKPEDPGEQSQRDQRSDRPQQLDGSQQGEPKEPKEGQPKPEPGGSQPESDRETDEAGRNQDGSDPARRAGAKRDDARGHWEVQLPRKQTEVFRNPLRDTQIPDRYHRWIERWRSRGAGAERRNG
ncbi:MAG: hypothetical protein JNM84_19555 [Planctomycetes bacterium]|nr:hypothetical protein [Planctomycetota bacterium]